jgi:hypothetical protein
MFFSRERKIFFNTQKLILGEGEFSISAENCRNKIFHFLKHILFLHNQETICLPFTLLSNKGQSEIIKKNFLPFNDCV